jgi:hypothetical protein
LTAQAIPDHQSLPQKGGDPFIDRSLVNFLFIIVGNYDYRQLDIQLSQSIQNR